MEQKSLHIIAFDVPYPANYGGVIDIYYKVKALHAQGVKIHLHCYEYGRAEALTLQSVCEKVYYYKRKMDKQQLLLTLPFVVASRSSDKLINNLLRDKHPVLFEGLHTCYYLDDPRLSDRIKIVRTHNIEHDYYKNLAKVERSVIRKVYFQIEEKKLKHFEKILHKANHIAAISAADAAILSPTYKNVIHIGAFHSNEQVEIKEGKGEYCLYHGNLEVGENNEAALYLVNEVFSQIKIPLIITGRKPSEELKKAVDEHKHIQLKANINTAEIDILISNAQINVLPTFQATGIKLKLLAALFMGRFCIVNRLMVVNTGLENLCSVQDTPEAMSNEISRLFNQPFDMREKEKRTTVLEQSFSNTVNAKKLMELL